MATVTRTKASIQDNLNLSKQLWSKGVSAEQALAYLKQHSYTVNGIAYNGVVVAQGVAMINEISNGLKAGKLKSSKAKGLYVP